MFAAMGHFMFFENQIVFDNYFDSMLYLFSAGVAEFEFSDMVPDQYTNYNP